MLNASSVFELLKEDYRRQILVLLCDSETVEVPEAVLKRGACAERQAETVTPGTPPTMDSTVAIELYHTHLPKLAAADVVDWDRDAGVVSRGPEFERIEPVVCLLMEHEDRIPGGLL